MITKEELIKKGKELGINLRKSMSVYEMRARIKEAEENLENKNTKAKKSDKSAKGGEY